MNQPIKAGDMAMLSVLFEAVGDLLTDAQRAELTAQLTSLSPAGVAPGDLITAEMFNAMINNINDLLARVAVLEGADGGPVITGILPGNQPISVNTVVTILGTGFNAERRLNKVLIDGRELTEFRDGSNATALIVPIPDLFSGLPRTIPISVETGGRRSNGFPITLLPAERLQIGDFEITPVSSPTGIMLAGATIIFEWDVLANTSLDDEITLELVASALTGSTAAQWDNAATFLPVEPVSIEPGDTRRIRATIVVPASAVRATLALRVKGIADQVISTSVPVNWVAGVPLVTSSTNAILTFAPASGAGPIQSEPAMNVSGTIMPGLRVRQGQSGIINFQVADQRAAGQPAATYSFVVTRETNTNQWTVMQGPTPLDRTIPAGGDDSFSIRLRNDSGPVDQISFLRVEANQTVSSGALQPYQSFITIPLRIMA